MNFRVIHLVSLGLPFALSMSLLQGPFAMAMGGVRLSEPQAIQKLFAPVEFKTDTAPAQNTFVIFLNGDQDHLVEKTTLSSDPTLYREDSAEAKWIRRVGKNCGECNLVFLHAQPVAAHWYTPESDSATYLRIYSRGSKLLERHVESIDTADPLVLQALIQIAAQAFPQTHYHLIYRGHSFIPDYDPATAQKTGVAPFDYGSPESPYGPSQFIQSIQDAGVPLSTITLAACRMAYLQLAGKLANLAQYLIASQLDFLEVLDTQVDYTFIWDAKDSMAPSDVARSIAQGLMVRDRVDAALTDAMMETPFSLIELAGMDGLEARFEALSSQAAKLTSPPETDILDDSTLARASQVVKGLSQRYIDSLVQEGKSASEVAEMSQVLKIPSDDSNDRDVGLLLGAVGSDPRLTSLAQEAQTLRTEIAAHVQVFFPGPTTQNSGLSFESQGI